MGWGSPRARKGLPHVRQRIACLSRSNTLLGSDRPEVVPFEPVLLHAAGGHGQDGRGQVADVHPEERAEAGVVHHELQVLLSLRGSSADELVAH